MKIKMKFFFKLLSFLLILFLFNGDIGAQKKITKRSFNLKNKKIHPKKNNDIWLIGYITQTKSWCGGMRPPDEYLKEISTPSPLAEKIIYIKKMSDNLLEQSIVDSAITDNSGKFKVRLSAGRYALVDSEKRDIFTYNKTCLKILRDTINFRNLDMECMKKHLNQPDATFVVSASKKSNSLTHNYHLNCFYSRFPCVEFTGGVPQ